MSEPLKTQEPDKKDWGKLYQTVWEFQLAAPWTWINSEEVVAVENPDNREVGFCSVLGSGGQEYGLGIYMGDAGYQGFRKLTSGKMEPEKFFEKINFPVLSLLMADREILQKKDLENIRASGLKFRGRNAWPLVRSVLPGYIPWFLTKNEALFFDTALQQILKVAQRISQNELDLTGKAINSKILTRCFREGQWIDEWRQPQPPVRLPQQEEEVGAVKEAQLLLLKNAAGPLEGEWELDWFLLPGPVQSDSGRPFYPLCILAIEKTRGLIIGTRLIESSLQTQQKQDEFIQLLEGFRPVPETIWINDREIKALLTPVTGILGINLRMGSLPMMKEARKALKQHFS